MGSMDKEHKMRGQYKFFPFAVIITISMGFIIGCRMEEIYSG